MSQKSALNEAKSMVLTSLRENFSHLVKIELINFRTVTQRKGFPCIFSLEVHYQCVIHRQLKID